MSSNPQFQMERGDGVTQLHDERPTESSVPPSFNASRATAAVSASSPSQPTSNTHLRSPSGSSSSISTTKSPNFLTRVWHKMRADSRPNRKPKWEIITEIRISVGVDEVKRSAVVLFDPQCPKDVISTRFLRNFPGLDYERSSESIGCSITGGERFKSIGRVEIRWHCGKRKPSLSRSPVYYLNCFEESTCLVVESEKFEVMIGRPAIEKLELYRSNHPLVAAFRGVTIGTDSTHDKQAQQAADIARKQAEQKQRQREKELEEKKEKERRKKESSKKK